LVKFLVNKQFNLVHDLAEEIWNPEVRGELDDNLREGYKKIGEFETVDLVSSLPRINRPNCSMMQIKTAFLLSYDYEMLKRALPLVYAHSDAIVLSTDINRRTYAGNYYEIPDHFFQWVKDLDGDNKIKIYEADFYIPNVRPMISETRQRRMTAAFMGTGGWFVQIDADEYFVNFEGFVRQLRLFERGLGPNDKVTVLANWITLYKYITGKGYLIALCSEGYENFWPATNNPEYTTGRICAGNTNLFADNFAIHESLSRGREALAFKLKNWSHSADFDTAKYLERYDLINEHNFSEFRNLHFQRPKVWDRLAFIPGNSIDDLTTYVRQSLESRIRPWQTGLRNVRGGGRLLSLMGYLRWR